MRCMLIALEGEELDALTETDVTHTLALACSLRDSGRISPYVVCTQGGWLETKLQEFAIAYTAIPSTGFGFWRALNMRWQTRNIPQLVIQTFGQNSVELGAKLTNMRPKNSTLLSHCFFLSPPSREQLNSSWIENLNMADCIICGSYHVRDRLIEYEVDTETPFGPGPQRLHLLQPGIDATGTSLLGITPEDYSQAIKTDSKKHFIFFMRDSFLPRSGAMLVIRAMSKIKDVADLPDWEVHLFGDSGRCQDILDEAKRLNVDSHLLMFKKKNVIMLTEGLRRAHACLVPGDSPEEAPVTIWSGMLAALPCIVSRSPLHEERLGQAMQSAVLSCDFDSPQELADAMITMLKDSELRKKLSAQARKKAMAHTLEQATLELAAFLDRCFARRGWISQED